MHQGLVCRHPLDLGFSIQVFYLVNTYHALWDIGHYHFGGTQTFLQDICRAIMSLIMN